jgi:hypothetical protein
LINNRTGAGPLELEENFCISQKIILNSIKKPFSNYYFWRTYDGAEIDLIEETDGHLHAFEFKMKHKRKTRFPDSFMTKYHPETAKLITPSNLFDLLD